MVWFNLSKPKAEGIVFFSIAVNVAVNIAVQRLDCLGKNDRFRILQAIRAMAFEWLGEYLYYREYD